jgi:hypothetical protein
MEDISNIELIRREIYIYMCLDGFWEYCYAGDHIKEPQYFPFQNPLDFYEPPYGTRFQETEQAIVQIINSGKLNIPTDVEKGDEIVGALFSMEFDKIIGESSDTATDESSLSNSGTDEVSVTSSSSGDSGGRKYSRLQVFQGPLPFDISLKPSKIPMDISKRISGISGISWDRFRKRWISSCWIDNELFQKFFRPKDNSDSSVVEALEEAKTYLLTVLLPQQAKWRLSQRPNTKIHYNSVKGAP